MLEYWIEKESGYIVKEARHAKKIIGNEFDRIMEVISYLFGRISALLERMVCR